MSTPTEKELRELNNFVAEHVMKWKRTENPDDWTDTGETLFWHRRERSEKVPRQNPVVVVGTAYNPPGQTRFDHSWRTFAPTMNPADALQVLERCLERPDIGDPVISKDGLNFWLRTARNNEHIQGEATTLPLAIALFARKLFKK